MLPLRGREVKLPDAWPFRNIERILAILLVESFNGDFSVSQSRFDAYAGLGSIVR